MDSMTSMACMHVIIGVYKSELITVIVYNRICDGHLDVMLMIWCRYRMVINKLTALHQTTFFPDLKGCVVRSGLVICVGKKGRNMFFSRTRLPLRSRPEILDDSQLEDLTIVAQDLHWHIF